MWKQVAEVILKAWENWSILVGAAIVLVALWFAPDVIQLNEETSVVFKEFHGYIGFAAVVLVLIILVRLLIVVVLRLSRYISDWRNNQSRRERANAQHDVVLQRLPYLESRNLEFLQTLLNTGEEEFVVPNDDGKDWSWLSAYADVTLADIGIPHTKYRIKPWVWKYLRQNPSVLAIQEVQQCDTKPKA